ncbi:MAG: acetylxylan esterase [Victivallales bacterium]|nr:acetylxylan esterase [Victivallales bacterium]
MKKLLKNMLLCVAMLGVLLVSAQGIDFKDAMKKIQAGGPEAQAFLSAIPADFEKLQAMVPGGKDFRVIYDFDPRNYHSVGYTVDNSNKWTGNIKQVAFWLQYKDGKDQDKWVLATIDAFSQQLEDYGVPTVDIINARQVDNLFAISNVEGFKSGFFPKGNIEFWGGNYAPGNAKKIPGASDSKFDFGDAPSKSGGYGSMQLHNFEHQQTVFAFNKFTGGTSCDLGIGNNPSQNPKANPDWSRSGSAKNYKSSRMVVAAKMENIKEVDPTTVFNTKNISISGITEKLAYEPGEKMQFVITIGFNKQKQLPEKPLQLVWTRTGDDGITEKGKIEVPTEGEYIIETSTEKDGFVRIQARLLDEHEIACFTPDKDSQGKAIPCKFDGGACVHPENLKTAAAEPKDFDEFWAKLKKRLTEVPIKELEHIKVAENDKSEVYQIAVTCPGPRPMTGYITVPKDPNAQVPIYAWYAGYGTREQKKPEPNDGKTISITINAHGQPLGVSKSELNKFFESLRSNGKGYALDPEQNKNPETAYFYGMVLRVLRSLEYAKSLPQWNRKELVVNGGSQGGLQTSWAAALDPDVTLARPSISWGCDFGGGALLKRLRSTFPLEYVPALDYYDITFHARRTKCKVEVTRAGLGDYTCPPSGLAIYYNELATPDKSIVFYQGSTHGFIPKNPKKFKLSSK